MMPSSKTHFILGGTAVFLAYLSWVNYLKQPLPIETLLIGAFLGLIASEVADVDMGSSKIAELIYTILGIGAIGGLLQWKRTGLEEWLWLTGGVVVLIVLIVQLKHRGITHSWGAAAISSLALYLVNPFYALAWLFGYSSHLLGDLATSGKGKYL